VLPGLAARLYSGSTETHASSLDGLMLAVKGVASHASTWNHVGLIGVTWWAFSLNPALYCLHLARLFFSFEALRNVITAVVRPAATLTCTFLLFMAINYVFSVLAFTYFSDDYTVGGKAHCRTLLDCFIITFDQGFKNDGGIGGFMNDGVPSVTYDDATGSYGNGFARFLFDHVFNILLMVLLLNMVFGVVIDAFAELRDEKEAEERDRRTRCPVCHLERAAFEVEEYSFTTHTKRHHHMLNYVHLVSYVLEKEQTELTGLESFLRQMIEADDPRFIPSLRAMEIERGDAHGGWDDAAAGEGDLTRTGSFAAIEERLAALEHAMRPR